MALFDALLRYKRQGQLARFDMHGKTKATIHLFDGQQYIVYMASQYIVGETDVLEALEEPVAEYLVYNNWDSISGAAERLAKDNGISVMKFGRFAYKLDELNA